MEMDYGSYVGSLHPDDVEYLEIMAHAARTDVADFQQAPSVDRIDFDGEESTPEERLGFVTHEMARSVYPEWLQPSYVMNQLGISDRLASVQQLKARAFERV